MRKLFDLCFVAALALTTQSRIGILGRTVPKATTVGQTDVTPSDLVYEGAFWPPTELGSDQWGNLAARYVGGTLHFFSTGSNAPDLTTTIASNASTTGGTLAACTGILVGDALYFTTNDEFPATVQTINTGTCAVTWTALASNPGNGAQVITERDQLWEYVVATPQIPNDAYAPSNLNTSAVYKKWGPLRKGHDTFQTTNLKTQGNVRPSLFLGPSSRMYYGFQDNYNVTGTWNRSLAMSILNDADGASNCPTKSYLCYTATSVDPYGPWFTAPHSHRTHKGISIIPSAFASAYLGGGSWLGLGAGLASGNAAGEWGNSLHVTAIPTEATPADSTMWGLSGSTSTDLIGFPYDTDPTLAHRMQRSNDYVAYVGNTFYRTTVLASPAPTATHIDVTPIGGVITTGAAGVPTGPTSIYVCSSADPDCGSSVRATANVTSISGDRLNISITSGSTPVAGDRVHGGNEGVYPNTNPVQITTGVPVDWVADHTAGSGAPAGSGFITQSDMSYSNAHAWVNASTKKGLIFAYYLCTGDVWYGSWQNSGGDHIDKSTGTTGPLCTDEHPYLSIWKWSTFGPTASSGNMWDHQPDYTIDLTTVANFLYPKKDYYTHQGVAVKGGPRPGIDGIYFDDQDTCSGTCAGRLYLFSRFGHMISISEQYPVMNVFKVAK